jgi:hypothetical protein
MLRILLLLTGDPRYGNASMAHQQQQQQNTPQQLNYYAALQQQMQQQQQQQQQHLQLFSNYSHSQVCNSDITSSTFI